MPPVPASLSELIDQLGRTFSPFERLKILGRAWALLRKMTPEQRMTVAAQLGLDHSDELVEAIAARSGNQASPALLAMIERAQVKGREHLPTLIADLRDPSRRAERLRQGARAALDEAENALGGETPDVPWLPPAAVAPPQPPPPAPAAAAPRTQTPRPQAPQPTPAATAQAPAKPAAPPQPVQAPAPAVVLDQPSPPPPPPPAVQAVPLPAPRPAEAATASPTKPPAPPMAPEARPVPVRPTGESAFPARLADASSLTERFHLLRRHLEEAKKLPADGLRSVLEAFPDGWARRRALVALLRAGAPGSLRDALALVETLGSDRDRLWCLGALTDSRELSDGDRQALLAVAATPVGRRRLEIRLGER